MICERCNQEFNGQAWQKLCKRCFAQSKKSIADGDGGKVAITKVAGFDTKKSIVRQVLYKVAGELLEKGIAAQKVNEYVEILERGFYREP